jgi:hypothetical protein
MKRFRAQEYRPAANPVHILKIKPKRDDVAAQAPRIGMYCPVSARGVCARRAMMDMDRTGTCFWILIGGVRQYCGCDLTL